jgi:uncharacterized membrane protein
MLHTLQRVSGPVLLTNLHLLFWLSLVPFATGWMGQNHRAIAPALLDGAVMVMVMAAAAYFILQGGSSPARAATPCCAAPWVATGRGTPP